MPVTNQYSQAVCNQFVLVMCHMKRGNVLSKKMHILMLQEFIELISNEDDVAYATIIPLKQKQESVEDIFPVM